MSIPEYDIAGRKALLVGAARGIGKGVAQVLAEAGAEVAIASLNIRSAAAAASEITASGGKAVAFAADATKAGDMERLAREVLDRFGPLDVLVNCVGDALGKPVAKLPGQTGEGMTEEEWHAIVGVNLTPGFTMCRAFGPHLLGRGRGSVINISGVAAFRGAAGRTAYAAAKAGLVQFTQALALEWAPYGVRVNSIAPGSFPDPAQIPPGDFQQREQAAATRVPLRRIGKLREVGLLALYLASDASAYVTGQTWCIDGGASIA
ncbi:MAG: SDR family oxidoreductase [Chloroflexi bacterium]|nr:SDR family oxidoreductase [Chloroflexota bacterium]